MAQGLGASVCQRAVGENPVPGFCPANLCEPPRKLVLSLPKETRMRGGVGAGKKPPATRLSANFIFAPLYTATLVYIRCRARPNPNHTDSN